MTQNVSKQAQYIKQIEEIVVDEDTVVDHFTKNTRNKNTTYAERSFKLSNFKDDGVANAEIGVDPREDGAYYDSSPHPIWIYPRKFVTGASYHDVDTQGSHEDIGLPNSYENKEILKDDPSLEEGTEEFEQAHKESMEEWQSLWRVAVKDDLKDEIEFVRMNTVPEMEAVSHSVEVSYV